MTTNMTRLRRSILTTLLAAALLLPGTTAYASEGGDADSEDTAVTVTSPVATAEQIRSTDTNGKIAGFFQKVITSADTVTYTNEQFTITITQEGSVDAEGNVITTDDSGTAANDTRVDLGNVTLTASQDNETSTTNKKFTVDKEEDKKKETYKTSYWQQTVTGDLNVSTISMPGVYTYIIKESGRTSDQLEQDTSGGTTWNIDQTEYRLRVYVERGGGNVITKTVTLEKIKDSNGNPIAQPTKEQTATFNNSVVKTGGFELTKLLDGTYGAAAADYDYPFDIKIIVNEPNTVPSSIKYRIKENGTESTKEYTLSGTVSGYDGVIKLKANQTAVFTNLPAGSYVTVQEEKNNLPDNCIGPKIVEHVPGTTKDDVSDENSKYKKDRVLVYCSTTNPTTLTYTNRFKQPTVTGVATNIAPYISLVALMIAGLTTYNILRRHLYR